MKSLPYRSMIVACLLILALTVGTVGCFGGGDSNGSENPATTIGGGVLPTVRDTLPDETPPSSDDELSTFRSKDPFIPQAQAVQPTDLTVTTTGGSTPTTAGGSTGGTVTTIVKPTTPSTPGTTSPGGTGTTVTPGSTEPPSTTSTTAPHVHTLKVLSIAQVGGAGAVTFQVDGSVYRDRRVGDVVSTSWGQIKVVDINTSSKVVTLVQGSETLVLSVGQLVYQ